MKRRYFFPINICVFFCCLFSSCSKMLDDPYPDMSIGENQIRPADIPMLVNGAYSKIQGISNQTYPIWDIYADDVISIQGGTSTMYNPQSYEACNVNPGDGFGNGSHYTAAYTAIGNANFVINYLRSRNITSMNKELGEALAIRAFCYFRLVQAYRGVVITLGASEDPAELKRPKNTEEEVYARIFTDLTDAENLLPSFSTANAMSKEAVQLLRARVHLNRGEKIEARKYAELVIGSPATALSEDFTSNFRYGNSGNKEILFRVVDGPATYGYDRAGMFGLFSPGLPYRRPNGATGNGQTWLNPDLVNAYEPGDARAIMLKEQFASSAGKVVTYLMKFSTDTLQTANAFVVYPMIRLSEAYLISAEVDARNGVVNVSRFNELRQKRNLSAKNTGDFADANAFLDAIEWERRKEFVGEGLRWQDMKRFGKAISWLTSKGQPDTKLILPFPNSELVRNPNLKQNEGYNL
ncbi:RagB/SusD family nutrient uptake outer membrane protein [Pseudoflavitalea rhizosphaerae]|uniref:RagB/SusD family nutrient uptake outer membrane protein n=1 Tax=Pseudoflavitalea rhizosphaerae TaxID=1884793 RepID=UPI000F8E8C6E|nr:RagB/SusD family nutrient uptake outer membrane protein [Pseudoflavitalea rhizosphaerae]